MTKRQKIDEVVKLKRGMKKALALVDYYNNLADRQISSEEELRETRSKMEFTQKQILRACLEIKKATKEKESDISS
ncbi:hypothetical protein COV19_02225 [Candidatus Woesearchaeota archaeon CG10_big_fil_rev_8_21_14_0_10_44_13]|nr:MAG: hypothetical protein COV19_02225 [Candidatus Woesearchaeota archaeon CG10_big_fil_rev_8_21_14_0_10_44_13]